MAPPIDPRLLAPQTQTVRKPATAPRPRGGAAGAADRGTAAPVLGRRSQPAVSVSLSAEALQLLNGNRQPARQARPQAPDQRPARPQATAAAKPAADEFELLLEDPAPQRREAPFAHVSRPSEGRAQLPGSRLDITV